MFTSRFERKVLIIFYSFQQKKNRFITKKYRKSMRVNKL